MQSDNGIFVQVNRLRKSYSGDIGEIDVLSGVDFHIAYNEVIAIIGASGVGKTTLLHILGTLDRPSSGKILYSGKDIFKLSDSKLSAFRNSKIGFVFQSHHLLPEFTALENVMIPCFLAGMSRKDAHDAAIQLLKQVDLEHRASLSSARLSGGEQQRVALARAMVMNPKLILADEPTGNLDEKSGGKVAELLFQMKYRPETSVVLVTHNLSLARLADRCLGLSQGRVVELEKENLAEFVMKKAA